MDLLKRLEDYRSQERELNWEGTFGDYFEIVTKNPKVARLSSRAYLRYDDVGGGGYWQKWGATLPLF